MKYLFLIAVIFLSGCNTAPKQTVPTIPDVPYQLLSHCPKLTTVANNETNIVNFSKIVLENYTKYHDCSNKIDLWIEWYHTQKNNK